MAITSVRATMAGTLRCSASRSMACAIGRGRGRAGLIVFVSWPEAETVPCETWLALASALAEKRIRVNAVAPGPIWTPLIPSTFPPEKVEHFGGDVPMKRPGEPAEVAPSYVFLASSDSSYFTGQVLHPNGGEVING